ncbi:MAG: hypothetical protein GYB68_17195 [Chloroflexi bacterium]|nr:hypothetical protein [Chloroflexota bacterium]
MGIQLDWDVESESGWDRVDEDAEIVAARNRRNKRIRNSLMALAAILLMVGGGIGFRAYSVNQDLRAQLEATVAAETVALRIGDRNAFLQIQSDLGAWESVQENTFDGYQDLSGRIETPGEIIELDMQNDQAMVHIREYLDGEPYVVTWFYRHEPGGWRHTPPLEEFIGERITEERGLLTISYYERDAAFADAVSARMTAWWDSACRLTSCAERPASPEIEIIVHRMNPALAATSSELPVDDARAFVVESPLMHRIPEGESIHPEAFDFLAADVAFRWAHFLLPIQEISSLQSPLDTINRDWSRHEVAVWLNHSFNERTVPSALFDELAQIYGPALVSEYIKLTEEGIPPVEALERMTGQPVNELPIDWREYFSRYLEAEITAYQELGDNFLYRDSQRPPVDLEFNDPVDSYSLVDRSAIDVRRVEFVAGIAWVEVVYQPDEDRADRLEFFLRDEDAMLTAREPFRVVSGYWVHTWPDEQTDWGDLTESVSSSGQVSIQHRALDEAAAAELLPRLEQARNEIATNFGLGEAVPALQVFILPLTPTDLNRQATELEISYSVSSSYGMIVFTDERHSAESTQALSQLINAMGDLAFGSPRPTLLANAIILWQQMAFAVFDETYISTLFVQNGQIDSAEPVLPEIDSLWDLTDITANGYDQLAAYLLVDLIAERYGNEAVGQLSSNLAGASSLDEWLSLSVGINSDELEADWQTAFNDLAEQALETLDQ